MNQNNTGIEKFLIEEYAQQSRAKKGSSGLFNGILAVVLLMCLSGGVMLSQVDISEIKANKYLKKMDVSFLVKEKEVKKDIPKSKNKKAIVKKPIKKAALEEEVKSPKNVVTRVKRKVYGVRKVYSKGLGSGVGGSDAVVAKLGNSLDVPPDTISATKDDLKGSLVSVTRISRMPKISVSAKPDYTSEMKKNNVSGKVKAKVLVDVDGKAKKIIILSDLGFGTKQSSITAIQKMKFEPGLLNDSAVAVWIPITFRFELQA